MSNEVQVNEFNFTMSIESNCSRGRGLQPAASVPDVFRSSGCPPAAVPSLNSPLCGLPSAAVPAV